MISTLGLAFSALIHVAREKFWGQCDSSIQGSYGLSCYLFVYPLDVSFTFVLTWHFEADDTDMKNRPGNGMFLQC